MPLGYVCCYGWEKNQGLNIRYHGDIVPLRIGDQIPSDGILVSGHLRLTNQDLKAPFLMSGCKLADGYGTMLLSDLTTCDACIAAGLQVQSQLLGICGNKSHSAPFFYFTILYAASVVNEFGPQGNVAISCTFNLQIKKPKKRHSAVDFGLIGASLVSWCLMARKAYDEDEIEDEGGEREGENANDEIEDEGGERDGENATVVYMLRR
ncbi:hypothetical protein ACH5RR_032467 [Cinchona calisaya]|uniref:Uncharacterized protein n=1 Tax=Cinchona calisaya TaxID=153742 RepID=A0ABD2YMD6_9GENT